MDKQSVEIVFPSRRRFGWRYGVCVVSLFATGCGYGISGVEPVTLDFDNVSATLMAEFDQDGNGGLSRQELAGLPPAADAYSRFDRNGDGAVSLEELDQNLRRIFDGETGLLGPACVVRRNGQPLAGAEVRFVPPPFLDDVLENASGVTGPDGVTLLTVAPEDLAKNAPTAPGIIRPGLYLVEVTHGDLNIPEKYNRKTTLGKEVSRQTVLAGDLVIDLKM